MTESADTTTNYSQSDCNNNDYPIDLYVVPIDQQEDINDKFGLFNDDDDEDNLTLLDLKFIPKFEHDLSIFDELAHQCNAVLLSTNSQEKETILRNNNNNNSYSSNLMTTTMINDYERRFQRSIQKLTIPSWYNDPAPSPKISTKPSIISTSHYFRESHRTPEIVHVHRPHSYRSCRSSLGTSPSPSAHSWHPNHIMDGMNFSHILPSSSSTSRRHNKYEKGIERVTKASHWYKPTQFIAKKENDQISVFKLSTINRKKSESNHYDIPKSHDKQNNNIKQDSIHDQNQIQRLTIESQSNYLIDEIDFNDIENTSNSEQNNKNDKGNIIMTYDKEQDSHIKSNEIQIMPLENEKISFARIELEEITDEEENGKRSSSTNNIPISSIVEESNDDETNTSLERLASSLVDSILNDVLLLKTVDHDNDDDDDTNTGVRELSDDENGLRELDENDMSGTDEFIVFATKAETSDDDVDENNHNNDNNNPISPIVNRGSLNRLYTFSRTNDDGTINNSKKLPSNQGSSTPALMIVDKNISSTNIDLNQLVDLDNQNSNNDLPIYRSHIQKRHINLGRYYDGMMRGQTSQLPTHDLRCNLHLNPIDQSITPSEGVTEETVRKGRILLDSIPDPIELKNQLNENISNQSLPIRSILKNTRLTKTDEIHENNFDDQILKVEEKERISPRKTITTITEEYHHIHRKIIEEYDDGETTEKISHDSGYLNNHERVNIQQSLKPSVSRNESSPYELLSECYSGYSFIQNNFLKPIKAPLISNVSSLQTTTDEAYESEPTISPRSPTMSSSTVVTTYIHPNLEHEFEYPSPPPPVPDRSLKPPHLRPPPPTKPRSHKKQQQQQQQKDSDVYSKIRKKPKTPPLSVIQHLAASTPNDSASSSTRTLSSRHYCGSLPGSNEPLPSSNQISDEISKENSKKHSNSSTNNNNNQEIIFKKSSISSLNKIKTKRSSATYFDEATNGLAIRLPASSSNGHDLINKQNLNRASTPSTTKRVNEPTKTRPVSENLNADRSSVYETSV